MSCALTSGYRRAYRCDTVNRPVDPLALFHPLVRDWFREEVGEPTAAQRLAWPRIAAGEHVLLTAPTGSGKTLAAFGWALDRLLTGVWNGGRVRVLYVSPLKALNTDVRDNLLVPLAALERRFTSAGAPFQKVRVQTRSGDTPPDERQRMARRPPEILITTPESLNILLTSRRGRDMLAGVATVILDEIHAVVGSKRGVHLITAIERVATLAGEVQRLALSATVRPLETVASWVGGHQWLQGPGGGRHRRRPVAIVAAPGMKVFDLTVHCPAARDPDDTAPGAGSVRLWDALTNDLLGAIARNRSTLVFANSRRMVEKIARLVNEAAREDLVFSHHGSLSREVRAAVEERLKAGELRAIVATSSLELGIDIGAIDEVILVQSPPGVASALQRIGRAGHQVGAVSRGRFEPLYPRDLLEAAVIARGVATAAIEEVRPVVGALDVLAQVVTSMTATAEWPIEELFAVVRCADCYHDLTRRQFDLVLAMLSGRYAEVRVRELKPLVTVDLVTGTVRARPGAERLVYAAGGTIADRGYFHLRREDTGVLLGELDEEFVWERSVGDAFTLGVQSWRIASITHNDVLVRPAVGRSAMAPFWRADERDRSWELSARVGSFLALVEPRLDDPGLLDDLVADYALDRAAAVALQRFLLAQRTATGRLPHRHRVVAERVVDPQSRGEGARLVLHTMWGGQVNRPFALALQAAWRERHGGELDVQHDDDCVSVADPGADLDADELLGLVSPGDVERLLRARLESSGFFGSRFRAAASCALLLPRNGFGRRTPLWLSRRRARDLMDAVQRFDDFPLLLEAWRTCLADDLDLVALIAVLGELADGQIEVWRAHTDRPSPFAAGVTWRRTNTLMYEDDSAVTAGPSRLRADLLREVAFAPNLRPRIAGALAAALTAKLRRLASGYAPRSEVELFDWIIERGAMPVCEWQELLAAAARDSGEDAKLWLIGLAGRITAVALGDTPEAILITAVQALSGLAAARGVELDDLDLRQVGDHARSDPTASQAAAGLGEPLSGTEDTDALAELVARQLRFCGPCPVPAVAAELGLDPGSTRAALDVLADGGRIVSGELLAGCDGILICDADNFERLLRLQRAATRPALEPLPVGKLPLFLATWQKLATPAAGREDLERALERLLGLSLPAGQWEREVLPARLDGYAPAWLDAVVAETGLGWVGCGEQRLAFAFPGDRELIDDPGSATKADLLPAGPGRFTFDDIVGSAGLSTAETARRLWARVWRGEFSNDTFVAVRQGLVSGFEPAESGPPAVAPAPGRRRIRFEHWRGTRPFAGAWFRLPDLAPAADALAVDELDRDRARLVLQRWGLVFRELLERESIQLRWGRLFRALRLLELGGEAVAGQFIAGVHGLQFALPAAVRVLQDGLADDRVFWHGATDPISVCGLGLDGLPELPRRVPGGFLVWHGGRLVVTAERRGAVLAIAVGPDDPHLLSYLGFLKVLLTRSVAPLRAITVETINDQPACESPYLAALRRAFEVVGSARGVRLMRRY